MDKILDIVASVTKKEKAFLSENLDNKTIWDSLTRVEVIIVVEEEFDIAFENDEIAQITTINALINCVQEKI